jgi:hypothetical protein
VPLDERTIDRAAIHFQDAPPWVDEAAVRRFLDRLTDRLLPPDNLWHAELAYFRNRPDLEGKTDDEILAEHLPQWEAGLALAVAALPNETWSRFTVDAVSSAVDAVRAYLQP